MNPSDKGALRTLDSVLDSFEDYVNQIGVDGIDLQQFVLDWQAAHDADLDRDTHLELLRVWMEYAFQAGSIVSVEQAVAQFPNVDFDDASRNVLEFERRRLESTWSVRSGPVQQVRTSLPNAPTQWEEFDLIAELGRGAFARVYLARQVKMANRLVALKITSRDTRESHWLARLQHSAVVPIYSVHQWGDLYGVCMPYLGNTTLADVLVEQQKHATDCTSIAAPDSDHLRSTPISPTTLLANGKSLLTCLRQRQSHLDTEMRKSRTTIAESNKGEVTSEVIFTPTEVQERTSTARELSKLSYIESIAWIGSQLANALEHAHRLGIVHCDIKPGNVLLASDGQPRLLDFNVAQEPDLFEQNSELSTSFADRRSDQLLIGGTPGYMPSEQVRLLKGDRTSVLDGRADVYALGAVMFELLAGRRPETAEMQGKRQGWLEKSLRHANTEVTPAFAAIITKCLAFDREDRYQTATELYEDLNAHIHHRPLVHLREPSLRERFHKWRRRHPSMTSVGSISSLATVLVVVIFGWAMRLEASKRLLSREIDRTTLVAQLSEAIPRASAAREYDELQDDVQRDAKQIASLLVRLIPHPITADKIKQHIPPETQQQLFTYAQLYQLSIPSINEIGNAENVDAQESRSATSLPNELATLYSSSKEYTFNDYHVELPQLYKAYLAGKPETVIESHRNGGGLAEADYARWLFVGHSYMQLEQWVDASEAYTYCLAIKPELAIARFYRGISRMKEERWVEAAEDFSATKLLQPSLMEARFNLAQVQKRLGRLELAETELTEAIDLGWQTVAGYYTRATLRKRLGDIAGAKTDYEMAMSLTPNTEADLLQLAGLALRNDPEQAERYYLQAIRRFPNSRVARQNLAHVLSESLQRPKEAIEVLTELIAIGNPLPEYFSGRGVMFARAQQIEAALADLRSAEELQPKLPIVQYQIACGYSLLAGWAGASEQKAYQKAALRWFYTAVRNDESLTALAGEDPDLRWLRNQEAYNIVLQALLAIDVALENE